MKLAKENKRKFDIFFFSTIFNKLEQIIKQLYKFDIIFHYLSMFYTQFYNIFGQKFVIYNLLKIFDINNRKKYIEKIKQDFILS